MTSRRIGDRVAVVIVLPRTDWDALLRILVASGSIVFMYRRFTFRMARILSFRMKYNVTGVNVARTTRYPSMSAPCWSWIFSWLVTVHPTLR